jgi:hypothetical protein
MGLREKFRVPRFLRQQKPSLLGAYHKAWGIIKDLVHEEKELHHLHTKFMKKYSDERLNELTEKKNHKMKHDLKHAEKYKKELDEALRDIARDFIRDMDKLYDLYFKIFGQLDEMVVFDDSEESQDLRFIQRILEKAKAYEKRIVFSERDTANFHSEFAKLAKKLHKHMVSDYRNDIYEEQGKDVRHVGFLKARSDSGLVRSMKHAEKKLDMKNDYWKTIGNGLLDELEHGVKPDFLSTFQDFIDDFAEVESAIRTLRKDMQVLIFHHVHEHNKEQARTYEFCMKMQSVFKEIHISNEFKEKLNNFYHGDKDKQGVGQRAIDFANKEAQNERVFAGELKGDELLFRGFLEKVVKDNLVIAKEAHEIANTKDSGGGKEEREPRSA